MTINEEKLKELLKKHLPKSICGLDTQLEEEIDEVFEE